MLNRVRVVSLTCLGVNAVSRGFTRGAYGSSGLFGFIRFLVHSLQRGLLLSCSSGFAWVFYGPPRCRWVDLG